MRKGTEEKEWCPKKQSQQEHADSHMEQLLRPHRPIQLERNARQRERQTDQNQSDERALGSDFLHGTKVRFAPLLHAQHAGQHLRWGRNIQLRPDAIVRKAI